MMVSHAEPYSYDDPGHGRTLEDGTHRYIGDADTVLIGNLLQHLQQLLEQLPPTPGIDHLLILPQAGSIQGRAARLGLPEIGLGQQPSTKRTVCEQRNTIVVAEGHHTHLRPQVNEGVLYLVRHHPNAMFSDDL